MQNTQEIMNNRSLLWDGCANVRDLGGLPLPEGAKPQAGRIIRSDFPGQLTDTGWQALAAAGVKTIIDLRAPAEVEKEPYAIPACLSIQYQNLPMEKFLPEVGALINKAQTRAEIYAIILHHYPDLIGSVLRGIAAVADGAVLIHCQAGKDRTGTISALLLDLAGVPREWISADYAESQLRLHHLYQQAVAEAGGAQNLGFWSRPTATAEIMVSLLEHIHFKYGSTTAYLRSTGLADTEIEKLRQKLVAAEPMR